MAVNQTHSEYDEHLDSWETCEDVAEGQREVHKKGVKYLPKLSGQTDDEYNAYKKRALFYEATGRTIEGLTGMIFRKPPTIEKGGMEEFLKDVTADGVNISDFAKSVIKKNLTTGRGGVLVDFTLTNTIGMTKAQAQAAGARPFLKYYEADSIINWKVTQKVQEVRLMESYVEQSSEFESEEKDQIRVLEIKDGLYQQRIFKELRNPLTNKIEWVEVETIYPLINGNRIDFIPFIFTSVSGNQIEIEEPPLMGLVNVNLSHYRNTADLEHGAHYTGLPTVVLTGVNDVDDKGVKKEWYIGSAAAWTFRDPNADAKYLEFEGKGLEMLENLLKAKEGKMASLGAQMLTPDTRRNEAADTAEMRHMGENSILSALAQTISSILNKALEYAGLWLGVTPATIQLNQDFLPTAMTPQMLTSLVSSWMNGAISKETLFDNLKAGEIIRHDKSFEDEESEIETTNTGV
jgi:hypothetical protein